MRKSLVFLIACLAFFCGTPALAQFTIPTGSGAAPPHSLIGNFTPCTAPIAGARLWALDGVDGNDCTVGTGTTGDQHVCFCDDDLTWKVETAAGGADGLGSNRDVGDATVSGGSGDVLTINAGAVDSSKVDASVATVAGAQTLTDKNITIGTGDAITVNSGGGIAMATGSAFVNSTSTDCDARTGVAIGDICSDLIDPAIWMCVQNPCNAPADFVELGRRIVRALDCTTVPFIPGGGGCWDIDADALYFCDTGTTPGVGCASGAGLVGPIGTNPPRQAATDCTAETGGYTGEMCQELDANALYVCETGPCDGTGWVQYGGAGSGFQFDEIVDVAGEADPCEAVRAAANRCFDTSDATEHYRLLLRGRNTYQTPDVLTVANAQFVGGTIATDAEHAYCLIAGANQGQTAEGFPTFTETGDNNSIDGDPDACTVVKEPGYSLTFDADSGGANEQDHPVVSERWGLSNLLGRHVAKAEFEGRISDEGFRLIDLGASVHQLNPHATAQPTCSGGIDDGFVCFVDADCDTAVPDDGLGTCGPGWPYGKPGEYLVGAASTDPIWIGQWFDYHTNISTLQQAIGDVNCSAGGDPTLDARDDIGVLMTTVWSLNELGLGARIHGCGVGLMAGHGRFQSDWSGNLSGNHIGFADPNGGIAGFSSLCPIRGAGWDCLDNGSDQTLGMRLSGITESNAVTGIALQGSHRATFEDLYMGGTCGVQDVLAILGFGHTADGRVCSTTDHYRFCQGGVDDGNECFSGVSCTSGKCMGSGTCTGQNLGLNHIVFENVNTDSVPEDDRLRAIMLGPNAELSSAPVPDENRITFRDSRLHSGCDAGPNQWRNCGIFGWDWQARDVTNMVWVSVDSSNQLRDHNVCDDGDDNGVCGTGNSEGDSIAGGCDYAHAVNHEGLRIPGMLPEGYVNITGRGEKAGEFDVRDYGANPDWGTDPQNYCDNEPSPECYGNTPFLQAAMSTACAYSDDYGAADFYMPKGTYIGGTDASSGTTAPFNGIWGVRVHCSNITVAGDGPLESLKGAGVVNTNATYQFSVCSDADRTSIPGTATCTDPLTGVRFQGMGVYDPDPKAHCNWDGYTCQNEESAGYRVYNAPGISFDDWSCLDIGDECVELFYSPKASIENGYCRLGEGTDFPGGGVCVGLSSMHGTSIERNEFEGAAAGGKFINAEVQSATQTGISGLSIKDNDFRQIAFTPVVDSDVDFTKSGNTLTFSTEFCIDKFNSGGPPQTTCAEGGSYCPDRECDNDGTTDSLIREGDYVEIHWAGHVTTITDHDDSDADGLTATVTIASSSAISGDETGLLATVYDHMKMIGSHISLFTNQDDIVVWDVEISDNDFDTGGAPEGSGFNTAVETEGPTRDVRVVDNRGGIVIRFEGQGAQGWDVLDNEADGGMRLPRFLSGANISDLRVDGNKVRDYVNGFGTLSSGDYVSILRNWSYNVGHVTYSGFTERSWLEDFQDPVMRHLKLIDNEIVTGPDSYLEWIFANSSAIEAQVHRNTVLGNPDAKRCRIASGTADAASTPLLLEVSPSPGWTTNEHRWSFVVATDTTTPFYRKDVTMRALVGSNDADTLTLSYPFPSEPDGQSFAIYSDVPCGGNSDCSGLGEGVCHAPGTAHEWGVREGFTVGRNSDLTHNTLRNVSRTGIYASPTTSTTVKIADNLIDGGWSGESGSAAIRVNSADDVDIERNRVWWHDQDGISVSDDSLDVSCVENKMAWPGGIAIGAAGWTRLLCNASEFDFSLTGAGGGTFNFKKHEGCESEHVGDGPLTADSGSTTNITDAGLVIATDELNGQYVWIVAGTQEEGPVEITDSANGSITVAAFAEAVDATTQYIVTVDQEPRCEGNIANE